MLLRRISSHTFATSRLSIGRDWSRAPTILQLTTKVMLLPCSNYRRLYAEVRGKAGPCSQRFHPYRIIPSNLSFGANLVVRLAAHEFDIVHRVTPLSPTSQSIIAARLHRLRIPFVIGPLNGGVPWPRSFVDRQHEEHEWLSNVRWLYKLMPAYRSTCNHSAAIIVGSKFTSEEMPLAVQSKCVYIPENGIRADQVIGHSQLLEKFRKSTSPKP